MDQPKQSPQKDEVLTVKLRAGWARVGATGRRVLLAVSGGPDSLALLDATAGMAASLDLRLAVACIDHGLREESREEAQFVEAAAKDRGLPFFTEQLRLEPGASLEHRARDARYEALERLRVRAGADLVATAHTASDQAETLLMRLVRGASLAGAAAVLPMRDRVVRPMLACTKVEALEYLAERRLWFVSDPMNGDPRFLRTRIRYDVIPVLERAAGPGATERLGRFAAIAGEDSALLDEWAEAARRRISLFDGSLDAVGLKALPLPLRRRVFAITMREAGLTADFEALDSAELALQGERAGATWPGGGVLRVQGGRVRLERGEEAEPAPTHSGQMAAELSLGGEPIEVEGRTIRWTAERPRGAFAQPVEVTGGRLTLRRRVAGDVVRLSTGGTRKLQDVLVDARVPREQRDSVALLVDSEGVVACVLGVWPRPRGPRSWQATWISIAPPIRERADPGGPGYKDPGGRRQKRGAGRSK